MSGSVCDQHKSGLSGLVLLFVLPSLNVLLHQGSPTWCPSQIPWHPPTPFLVPTKYFEKWVGPGKSSKSSDWLLEI